MRLYSVLDTVVLYGDDVCCSVLFDTLVGVFVFSVMWSKLPMTSDINWHSDSDSDSIFSRTLLGYYTEGMHTNC